MLIARTRSGFTLIELMVALVIVGVLFGVGLPNFRSWVANTRIRTAAESILNGMQIARTEAVRRNKAVRLDLGPNPSDWQVHINAPPALLGAPAEPDPVQQRTANEGSSTATVTATPGGALTITFNGMGWVIANADASASITRLDVSSSISDPALRPLRITVGTGGVIKMCDPNVASTEPRGC